MTRLTSIFFALAASALLPAVSAHGYIGRVSIDGTLYEGNEPTKDQGVSPIRMVASIDPVKLATDPQDLTCGPSAELAQYEASANPGSNVTIQWVGGQTGDSNWPHNVGPIMTYMAQCDGSCTMYNSSDAEFFKVAQMGQVSSDSSTWYQADIMAGDSYWFTIPENIAPGSYLIRSEIISLQLASSLGGAEFYPGCIQVNIGGSGTATPDDTVTFPGGYNATEAGVYTPDVYNPGFEYVFPGPPISNVAAGSYAIGEALPSATFVSGSVASAAPTASATGSAPAVPTSAGASTAASPTSAGEPTASATASLASAPSGTCRLRPTPVASGNATLAKRAHQRMRRMMRHSA